MLSNRLVFAALALACVTAAGAGGYLATRQASLATEAAGLMADAESARPDQATVPVVRETEAPVTSAPGTPAVPAAAAPAETPAPASTTAAPAAAAANTPAASTSAVTAAEPRRREAVRPRAEAAPAARPPATTTARTAAAAQTAARPAEPQPAEMPRTVPPTQAGGLEPGTPIDAPPATSSGEPRQAAGEAPAPVETLPSTAVKPSNAVDLEELTVAADSVIGLELDRPLSSERARVEDQVEARVARDVRVGRRVAIPAGAKALGSVMVVERGGKFKERARLGIRFHTLVLADGTRLPIETDTIYRNGDAPGDGSARKIGGGAVAGAILGAIIGGAKGAAVGATAGAGGGTAMVMSGDRRAAEFPAGAEVTARILSPVTVTLDR